MSSELNFTSCTTLQPISLSHSSWLFTWACVWPGWRLPCSLHWAGSSASEPCISGQHTLYTERSLNKHTNVVNILVLAVSIKNIFTEWEVFNLTAKKNERTSKQIKPLFKATKLVLFLLKKSHMTVGKLYNLCLREQFLNMPSRKACNSSQS